MSTNKRAVNKISDSKSRKRLQKAWGRQDLQLTEKRLLEESPGAGRIVETKTRARLRREWGAEELARVEAELTR